MSSGKRGVSARLLAIRATSDQTQLIAALEDVSHLVVEAAAERINLPQAIPALLRAYL